MYVKHKRSYLAIALIIIAMLLVSVDKKRDLTTRIHEVTNIPDVILVVEPKDEYVSNRLGLYEEGTLKVYMNEVEILFNKFEVPYEYRDYIRQLCEVYKVPTTFAISIAQIETHNGHIENYKVKTADRMYLSWNKETETYLETWDIGYFQMTTSLSDYWEDCFFNPELMFSLGYVRNNFDLTDDIQSIQIGISYIGYLLKYYHGDQYKTAMAFNAGMGNVNRGNIPKITFTYANAVNNNWKYREKDV